MQVSEIYMALGEESFAQLLKSISIGKLKTYQLYDRMKVRFHLAKLNSETLRKAAPRFWSRISEGDEEFASELAQTILVSHLDLIVAVLDFLKIPHDQGFFAKDLDPAPYLTEGWQEKAFENFKDQFPQAVLLFYLNHLAFELEKEPRVFAPVKA